MTRRRETAKRGKRPSCCGLASLLPLILMAGCTMPAQNLATQNRPSAPLFGEFKQAAPGTHVPRPPVRTQTGVPPIPAAQLTPSPAELAASSLPGGRTLAITPAGYGQPANQNPAQPASFPGAFLKGTEPIVQPVPREEPLQGPPKVLPESNPPWSANPGQDPLQVQLRARS